MHIALHGGDHDLALGPHVAASRFDLALFFFDVRDQVGHGLLHHPRRFHHLRQEHLARAEKVADHVHAVHQRPFDHFDRPSAPGFDGLPRVFGVLRDVGVDAVHQRMRQAIAKRCVTPGQVFFALDARTLDLVGKLHQPFGGRAVVGGVFAADRFRAIQHHVFDQVTQHRIQVGIHAQLAGVDDTHRQAFADRVVQEHGVDGFAHRLVAAEREADVGNAARNLGVGQVLADPLRAFDEVDGVVIVFIDPGRDGEHVGVEDDVFRRKADFINEQAVGPFADDLAAFQRVGLALFVKCHDDDGRAVTAAQARLAQEGLFAFLHGNGVDDRLALHALEPGFDHAPLAAVDHDRHARDIRLGCDQV